MSDPDLSIGTELPGFSRTVDQIRMVMYAGATWDWHRLHYDTEYASELGLVGPIADGQMFGAYLAEQVLRYLGPMARLRSMSFRFRAMVFAGETVTVTGRISKAALGDEGNLITVDQQILVGDRVCVTGTTVALALGI